MIITNQEDLMKTINDLEFQVVLVNQLLNSNLCKEEAQIVRAKVCYLEADLDILYKMYESDLNALENMSPEC